MSSWIRKTECGFNDQRSYGQQMVTKIQNSSILKPHKEKERIPSGKLEMHPEIGLQILSKYLNA